MAFTVEDGTGLNTANAYISVAYADAYHVDRGHEDWSGGQAEKERAIIRATDYVDKRFGRRFRGVRRYKQQALEWPRLDAYDNDDFLLHGQDDDVPRQLEKAIAEYAIRALVLLQGTNADLAPDGASPTGDVEETSVRVGPIMESVKYRTSMTRSAQSSVVGDASIPEYPAADLWLEELLLPTNSRRMKRA
jgi:hypothetical protein